MIAKKTLTTTGSEYSSYSDNEHFVKIHLTQVPTIVSNWKAIQRGFFIHLWIEKPP